MKAIKPTEMFRDRTAPVMKHGELSAGDYSKGPAEVLSVSPSTVNRWKASGLLDEATYQNGKYVLFDVYGVLEILRVNNRKNKYNVKN